ncbi:hypothetical protein FNU76_14840 [Chitinimonas arctica]|uniref:Uncharacterized protein n=1 Tax=Chitinimonas arctica TaxID=2594795 RepID=A0A516SH91_9NEIS|nr:hypothetical protein [Chitinimonas arctica]QDQ27531.1 hypothetical protein FNU76_14840 [Chitinimonas arctica]
MNSPTTLRPNAPVQNQSAPIDNSTNSPAQGLWTTPSNSSVVFSVELITSNSVTITPFNFSDNPQSAKSAQPYAITKADSTPANAPEAIQGAGTDTPIKAAGEKQIYTVPNSPFGWSYRNFLRSEEHAALTEKIENNLKSIEARKNNIAAIDRECELLKVMPNEKAEIRRLENEREADEMTITHLKAINKQLQATLERAEKKKIISNIKIIPKEGFSNRDADTIESVLHQISPSHTKTNERTLHSLTRTPMSRDVTFENGNKYTIAYKPGEGELSGIDEIIQKENALLDAPIRLAKITSQKRRDATAPRMLQSSPTPANFPTPLDDLLYLINDGSKRLAYGNSPYDRGTFIVTPKPKEAGGKISAAQQAEAALLQESFNAIGKDDAHKEMRVAKHISSA